MNLTERTFPSRQRPAHCRKRAVLILFAQVNLTLTYETRPMKTRNLITAAFFTQSICIAWWSSAPAYGEPFPIPWHFVSVISLLAPTVDCNTNGTDDSLEPDCNTNGTADACDLSVLGSGTATNSTPAPIFDFTAITSTVAPAQQQFVTDANVQVSIRHTADGNLTLSLSHLRTTVTLAAALGGTGDNFSNTVFDQQAASSITAAAPPFAGTFRAQGNLNAFNGLPKIGTWTLKIVDPIGGDTGTLLSWSLLTTHRFTADCNSNGTPDVCELTGNDCNTDNSLDACEVQVMDCNTNQTFDLCELAMNDCNTNSTLDVCELTGRDCNTDRTLDVCELSGHNCNSNGTLDICELPGNDCNSDGTLDFCQLSSNDCNTDGFLDACQLTGRDCDSNGTLDQCELIGHDCNSNHTLDVCDLANHDCNTNARLDACEISGFDMNLPGSQGGIRALTVHDGLLLAGNDFLSNPVSFRGVSRWNGTGWQPFGAAVAGSQPYVYALTICQGDLIAGGPFSTAGNVTANGIARWDGNSWQPLGAGFGLSTHPAVLTMTNYQNELIAAGYFSMAGGLVANNIAAWNGASWRPLGSGTDGHVQALTVFEDTLIAGGSFSAAGGVNAPYVARWNGSIWQPMGTAINGAVDALTVYNGQLIAGGSFFPSGGSGGPFFVAHWNGTDWQQLGGGVSAQVYVLATYGSNLIAGGDFLYAGGQNINTGFVASYVAQWNGSAWLPMQSGSTKFVQAMTIFENDLILGNSSVNLTNDHILNWNGVAFVPYGQQMDCNTNHTIDACDIHAGQPDTNNDGYLDICELTTCPTCPGDLNADAHIDAEDIPAFIRCSLATPLPTDICSCSANLTAAQFIASLLQPGPTPCP